MSRYRPRRSARPPRGAAPGTLVISPDASASQLHFIKFNQDRCERADITSVDEVQLDEDHIVWLDVQGLGDERMLRALADRFHIHPLALEDIVHIGGRPKSEAYDKHHLLITRMVREQDGNLDIEQVAIVVFERLVITFQEHPGDVFEPVRTRLGEATGRIRSSGADYLAYTLIDAIVDGYYPVVEKLAAKLERLEQMILSAPNGRVMADLHGVKEELLSLRRVFWPQRDALVTLVREPQQHISDDVRIYLRDTTAHCAQAVDAVDGQRELSNSLMNLYLSVMSHRTNEIMKVLTIMASVFIPLTFIAGVYGMNFQYMPELSQRWGYPVVWAIMIASGLGMLGFFRKRGWL